MNIRERLIERNGGHREHRKPFIIPPSGKIDARTVAAIQRLAIDASNGDLEARDTLYWALQPRLERIGTVLRPWPNTPHLTGVWDRDDVRQESWIIYVELLAAWDHKVTFVPYFLARFAWRLRDRILRGIGKSQTQFGHIRVPEDMLPEVLLASSEEQPESAAVARKLLEHLIKMHMSGAGVSKDIEAWLEVVRNQELTTLASADIHQGTQRTKPERRVG